MSFTPTPHSELLQSPLWGQVQTSAGRRVFYVKNCLIIKHALPFGKSWLYSPRPIITDEKKLNELAHKIAAIAKQEKAIFWKIDGIPKLRITNYKLLNSSTLQYPETFILDLSKTEDELLKNMKPKTRYNIGLARKKNITIRWSQNSRDIPLFYKLLDETANRQKIAIHKMQHYKNILSIFAKKNAAALGIAYYEDKPVAANLVTFYGDAATYLHGGTEHSHRNLMAPYLLQWETIQEAKQRGLRFYDLGGVAVHGGKIKEWAGITRFKEGFGGTLTDMGETYDVVFNRAWYALYKYCIRLKRIKFMHMKQWIALINYIGQLRLYSTIDIFIIICSQYQLLLGSNIIKYGLFGRI